MPRNREVLDDLGLGSVTLGRSSKTLSAGEARASRSRPSSRSRGEPGTGRFLKERPESLIPVSVKPESVAAYLVDGRASPISFMSI